MYNYSYAVLFLGLIFDVILLLFVVIAILLIYSLLMISVETKTFELGVIRMVGLSAPGVTALILFQSLLFVLPALLSALIVTFPVLTLVYSFLFTADLGIDSKPVPSPMAFLQALIVGLVIPVVSAIIPIRKILGKNLNDALDYQRSKTQAVYVEVLGAKED